MAMWRRSWALLFMSVVVLLVSCYSQGGRAAKSSCKVCKDFVEAFEKGLKSTENSNYAGGDTSWEEEKLGSYANSEVRLVEVLDTVCKHSDYECHSLLEHNEESVEKWWLSLRHENGGDLESWLCFEHMDVCCPENTAGPECTACPGGAENPCGGHGKCEGAGEKDGTGVCSCDKGYEGEVCESCSRGFYKLSDSCIACDRACKDACSGPGAVNCEECADGYVRDGDDKCRDKDECKEDDSLCKEGTYCLNTPGSYRCNDCDKSCKGGCKGHGSAMCVECADGYVKSDRGVCEDTDECSESESLCEAGTYCENLPGNYICKACHVSCLLECSGEGAGKCSECKDGYSMLEGMCEDVNECNENPNLCNTTTELCHNLPGSHMCKCKTGLTRVDGVCTEVKQEEGSKKTGKRKKGKKSKGAKREGVVRVETNGEKSHDRSADAGPRDEL